MSIRWMSKLLFWMAPGSLLLPGSTAAGRAPWGAWRKAGGEMDPQGAPTEAGGEMDPQG
jgi:hypothetical protein